VLSHRKLTVDVHRAELTGRIDPTRLPPAYEKARVVAPADLATLAIATLTRKILRRAGIEA
jgi:hypothetical protein